MHTLIKISTKTSFYSPCIFKKVINLNVILFFFHFLNFIVTSFFFFFFKFHCNFFLLSLKLQLFLIICFQISRWFRVANFIFFPVTLALIRFHTTIFLNTPPISVKPYNLMVISSALILEFSRRKLKADPALTSIHRIFADDLLIATLPPYLNFI